MGRLSAAPKSEFPIPFARLYDHLCWADRKVLESLRSTENPPARALALYAHVLGAEHVWLTRIHSKPAAVAVWPSLTIDECEELANANCEAFGSLVKTLTPASLAKQIAYTNTAGASFISTLEDILVHVALHGSYHRGQIAISLRESGEVPAPTDYIAFARGSSAAIRTTPART
ncbi:MAG TPA: DinB family protein [Gemmatimonadaceae bacterium]|nr:DinB family protein [Gemmatimonadaceae bacterium]